MFRLVRSGRLIENFLTSSFNMYEFGNSVSTLIFAALKKEK
jgi:hypothetical protein